MSDKDHPVSDSYFPQPKQVKQTINIPDLGPNIHTFACSFNKLDTAYSVRLVVLLVNK